MTAITWTKARRKRLHGFLTPSKTDPADAAPTLAEAWTHLRALPKPALAAPAPAPAVAALASHDEATPPTGLDRRGEYCRTDMFFQPPYALPNWEQWAPARALVALWSEAEGLPFALEVLLQPEPYGRVLHVAASGDKTFTFTAAAAPSVTTHGGPFALRNLRDPLWWALRNRVAQLDDAAFASLRQACAHHFEGLPAGGVGEGDWWRRSALVWAFARDEGLAAAQIDKLLAKARSGWNGADLLIAAAPDIDRAAAIAEHTRPGHYSIDVIARFRDDALPLIQGCFERARKHTAMRYLKHERAALKLLGAPA
jgi:hypothetical protein